MRQQVLLFLSLSLLTFRGFCQINVNVVKAADKAFEDFSYSKAASLYSEALKSKRDSNSYVLLRLADSYRLINQPDSVVKYLQNAVTNDSINPDYLYYYAEALAGIANYEEAKNWYQRYEMNMEQDNRVPKKLYVLDHLDLLFQDSSRYTLIPFEYNSPGQDFSPAYYNDQLLFVSSRPNATEWINRQFNWDESRYLDIYSWDSTEIKSFSEPINSVYHEGPFSFYNDFKNLAFTRNNLEGGRKVVRDDKGVTRLKIFFATLEEGEWENFKEFSHNNDAYSVGHPAMAADGSFMIFASDMPESIGGSDLYISYNQQGTWSKPQNLGSKINTTGKELFPTINDGYLYFSSDGQGGLGGLDIFRIELNEFGLPVGNISNLGFPLNSSSDDFGLVLLPNDRKSGVFSSSRNKASSDDLFFFKSKQLDFRGRVISAKTKQPLEGADIWIGNKANTIYTRTDADGYFVLPAMDSSFTIEAVKFNYLTRKIQIDSLPTRSDLIVTLPEVGERAKFPMSLDQFVLYSADTLEDMEDKLLDIIGTISSLDEENINDPLKINPIYFDLDDYHLRPESYDELNKVYAFLKLHPDVIMELSSHTDDRASKEYNLILSHLRANSVYDYLIEKGIDHGQLIPQGYGETQPVIDCDSRECSEEEYQLNRRTEFYILGHRNN